MGEYAEERIEREMFWDLGDEPYILGPLRSAPIAWGFEDGFFQDKVHTTKNGRDIRLEEMTPRHRGNTVRLFERRTKEMVGRFKVEKFRIQMRGRHVEEIAAATKNLHDVDRVALLHMTPLIRRMLDLGIE